MRTYDLYEMNEESMRSVCAFFDGSVNARGTAKAIGTNGAFMNSLVKREIAVVVGKELGDYFAIGNGLYRRAEANIYALTISARELWEMYAKQMRHQGENRKEEAEMMIDNAQRKLEEARRILSKF